MQKMYLNGSGSYIKDGIMNMNLYEYVPSKDSLNAIKKAIKIAQKEKDTNVLIVGKGIEECQIVGDRHIPYSDYEVVNEILKSQQK